MTIRIRPLLSRAFSGSLTAVLVALLSCSSMAETSTVPQPQLCDIDGGRWCTDCTGPQCTEGKSGWLCCSNGICVAVAVYGDCKGGVAGWCNNYTETTTAAGNVIAQCHD
jgi:hypothetical protein